MKVERASLSFLVVLFICKSSLGGGLLEEHGQQTQAQQQTSEGSEEQRRDNDVAAKDFMRYFLMNFRNYPNINHYGRNTLGIPFRPVRRIGSEFLGKRKLGSEFLGKRSSGVTAPNDDDDITSDEHPLLSSSPISSASSSYHPQAQEQLAADKRARLGSEFLGKRRPNLWDWSFKRGLGSEFLGKRVLGSEFLGKRNHQNNEQEELLEGIQALQ